MSPSIGKPRPRVTGSKFDWIALAAIGLLVQGCWALRLEHPTYMDAFYYATNGQRLAAGYGFTEEVIWQFLDNPTVPPVPSHTYWMPLPSIVAATGYTLWNDFKGAQLLFWLLGGLLPLLAYGISHWLSGERWQAWAAALLTATGGYYAAFLSQPTTFAVFSWAGASSLLALGLATIPVRQGDIATSALAGENKKWVYWLMAGLTAGLAHLTRADGLLFLLIGLLVWLAVHMNLKAVAKTRKNIGDSSGSYLRSSITNLLFLLGGYLLIMGGWFIRNWLVSGRPLSTVGAQSMFLTTYDDLFAYGRTLNLSSYLAWGWTNILYSKIRGTWLAVQTFVAIPGLIFLVPLIILAWVRYYRKPDGRMFLRPLTWYTIALFITMSLLFTFPGMRGSLFHSSIAIWPWSMALAAAGVGLAVDWTAARLHHWQPERAKRIFSGLFIIVALVLSVVVSQDRLLPAEDPDTFEQIGALLPASSVVMVGNAPAFHYFTGLSAVSIPNESLDVVLEAAERYRVTHVILNANSPRPLQQVYTGGNQHSRLRLVETFDDAKLFQLAAPTQ